LLIYSNLLSISIIIILKRINELFKLKKPFFKVSFQKLNHQINLWNKHIPLIQPHYAVKCNNDNKLIKYLANNKVNFDCASRGEIKQILDLGINSDRIIYANPYKNSSDIKYASEKGVPLTVVDSVEELNKLNEISPEIEILVRVKVNDKDSLMPFSSKFGSDFEETMNILKLAYKRKINISGFSFHVGSGCQNSNQYYDALKMVHDIITKSTNNINNINHNYKIIDIGGGFTGDDDIKFLSQADKINKAIQLFKNTKIKFISEPGRFYMTKTHTLYVPIIAKRKVGNKFFYIVDESLYSSFSNIAYDMAQPVFKLMKETKNSYVSDSVIFGRTCDSQDKLMEMKLPELEIGDYFEIENMGAYTTVSSTKFNGFPLTKKFYIS
jgi:ornithine decarboxylase